MPWQPCTGSCGQETQIRQRVFCCPGSLMNISVALRTLDLCTKTCKTPKHYLTEGKHCHRCSNNGFYNRTAKACVCRKTNKGQCCQENITCSNRPCKHGVCYDTPPGSGVIVTKGFQTSTAVQNFRGTRTAILVSQAGNRCADYDYIDSTNDHGLHLSEMLQNIWMCFHR
uniref:Uncharacterized protein LOC111136428 n=1 Tax=Crassostrea virginica TaxID=6565 RepID=A0A8B8ESQ2_CRAVI|nr:uncharacterized protein LOC111136428 [Crassostrea virginica]